MGEQSHVTDVNDAGVFRINTFERALRGVSRRMRELPQVIHFRTGRPESGIATHREIDAAGRSVLHVIRPALGPEGPYLQTITVPADDIRPHPLPLREAKVFLSALAQYSYNSNDYYWQEANKALEGWRLARDGEKLGRSPSEWSVIADEIEIIGELQGVAYDRTRAATAQP